MSTGSGLSELRSDITAGRIPISSGTLTDSSFSGAATITSGSAAVSTLSVSGTGTTTVSGSLTVGSSTPWGNPLFLVGTSSPNFFIDRNSGLVGIGTSNPNSGYALTVQNPSSTITGINLTDSAGIQYGNISGFNINVKGSYVFPSGLTGLEMAFVSGRYAYVSDADGGAFIIFDVTDPANPVLISRTTTSGFGGVHGVFVQGPYAYLARRNLPFVVADISNPTSPTVVGQVTLSVGGVNGTRGISVQGHYVYLSVNNNLIAIDVSNPAAPVQVGVLNDVTNLNGDPSVVVQGRYAYVIAAAGPILSVIDISNPTSMVLVGHVTLGALASVNSSIAVSGKYAYIAGKDTLFIADISNPASPVLVSTLTDTTNFAASSRYFISVSGHYAYTVGNNVTITDITNSASPVIVTSKNLYNTSLRGVTMSGRYLYVGVYGEGHFDIVDTAGLDVPNASIGNIQSSDMTIWNNMDIGNNLNVRGGLTIGNGGISSIGPLSVSVASTSQTSAISAYFQGRVGIGSTTPWGQLSVNPNALGSGVPEFVIGSSTATHFVVDGAGRIGIGTASPLRVRQQMQVGLQCQSVSIQ
ncbi:MAG: hypothetical protein NT077_00225 [Candidatus Taylorbacteria bacterium]|nr:hypothetical protein [Candidatus Taylorbacteria bacterium]